jgi:transcriptional regulator with PAS, ATPase and Fis domain
MLLGYSVAGRRPEDVPTIARSVEAPTFIGRLALLVIGKGEVATHPLPDNGEITVGRAGSADISINDPSVSRRHVTLHLGRSIMLEDLGSANGTRLHGERLTPHQQVTLHTDETFEIGSVMLVIQQRGVDRRTLRIWRHDYFEGRLADECARAERSEGGFAVVRLNLDRVPNESLVQEALAASLREVDVVGIYAPAEYELLLVETTPDDVAKPIERVVKSFAQKGITVRTGVAHFPIDGRDADSLLARAAVPAIGTSGENTQTLRTLVVQDEAMLELRKLVERVAVGNLSVLILGETGVGKELLAESVHRLSRRAEGPFVRLNCAALSDTLLESELFGHERGAFTGAVQAKQGLLETAVGGTVFLDEVGELPLSTQVKLLRVLEERQVLRVGALKPKAIDVRFVAATNRDLEAECRRGTFREDLYFRLNGISLSVPPLRERAAEIPALAEAFIVRACHDARRRKAVLDERALQLLQQYSWPGNVRELRNAIERACLLCGEDGVIRLEHLPVEKMRSTFISTRTSALAAQPEPEVAAPPAAPPAPATSHDEPEEWAPVVTERARAPVQQELDALERKRIAEALEQCSGNQTRAAKLLGFSRRTLVNRLEQYKLPRPRKNP